MKPGTSGCVNWPTEADGYHDSGEGGLWAYVFFAAEDESDPVSDPSPGFDECHTPAGVIMLPLQDVVAHDPGKIYAPYVHRRYPELPRDATSRAPREVFTKGEVDRHVERMRDYDRDTYSCGVSVLAAVCLGSTGESLFSEAEGQYYQVGVRSLTAQGGNLVHDLSKLYGRQPRFVTYLDT